MSLLDQLGNWNPQLLRELKGRLNPRTIGFVLAIALFGQLVFMGLAYSALPLEGGYSSYCAEMASDYTCARDAAGNVLIAWDRWWTDLFRILNWLVMVSAILTGPLMLSSDLCLEDQRGTLDAIRLSPQSSYKFLLGKLLGVPVLVYLLIALVLPLHGVVAIQAGVVGFWVGFYVVLAAACLLLFSAAMLLGLLGRQRSTQTDYTSSSAIALVAMVLTLCVFLPTFIIWNLNTVWNQDRLLIIPSDGTVGFAWYGLSLSTNLGVSYGLTLAICAIGTVWLWQALDRRFYRPNATLLSKGQSYGLVLSLQGLVMGLFIGGTNPAFVWDRFVGFAIVTFILFLAVMVALANSRQMVLDWARYRHWQPQSRHSLLRDLLWRDGSPMVGAIALNLVITAVLVSAWVLLLPNQFGKVHLMLNVLLGLSVIALYAIVVQFILLSKSPRRAGLALLSVVLLLVTPLLMAAIELSNQNSVAARIWMMFTPVPMFGSTYFAPLPTMMLVLLGQWSASVLLLVGLTINVRQLGSTSTKALFGGANLSR